MSEASPSAPAGASVWERELFEHLTSHAREEGLLLEEYVRAASDTDSRALAYIINLLVEDERRHHRHFAELASSLHASIEDSPVEPEVPRLDFNRADREQLLALTRRLLARESADAAELKRLRKQLRSVEETTLWALLVDSMQRDTDKHMDLLGFIERHLTKSGR